MQTSKNEEDTKQVSWFALHTRYQHEKIVATALEYKGIETFLPTYQMTTRWNDRVKTLSAPLFPGYLFVANIEGRKYEIANTRGVASVVNVAGVPAEIPTNEIEAIRRTIESRLNVEPHEFLREGDEVKVTCGPLAGMEGILVRKRNSLRLVVSIELLGRAAAVEIDSKDLERLGSPQTQVWPS